MAFAISIRSRGAHADGAGFELSYHCRDIEKQFAHRGCGVPDRAADAELDVSAGETISAFVDANDYTSQTVGLRYDEGVPSPARSVGFT